MFFQFVRFELKHWLRRPAFYIFVVAVTLCAYLVSSSDRIIIGTRLDTVNHNAPFAIQSMYADFSLFCSLLVTTFVSSSTIRDFTSRTGEMIFTRPIREFDYLLGRFVGTTILSLLPLIGISLGVLLASMAPFGTSERFGPTVWSAHASGFLLFALPNTVLVAAIILSLSLWWKKTSAAFVAVLVFIMGNLIARTLTEEMEYQRLLSLIDPMGITAFANATRYWTVADRNIRFVLTDGLVLWNRFIWLVASAALIGLSYWRFSFANVAQRTSSREAEAERTKADGSEARSVTPAARVAVRTSSLWDQWIIQFWMDLFSILRNPLFLMITTFGMFNVLPSLLVRDSVMPVTWWVVDNLRERVQFFLIIVVVYYSGWLVWRERESRIADIRDAMPISVGATVLAKLGSLLAVVMLIKLVAIGGGIAVQLYRGVWNVQPVLYFQELVVIDFVATLSMIALAIISHVLVPNKYAGYILFFGLAILDTFAWDFLGIESFLLRFGDLPGYTYSDLYGFSPYSQSLVWFGVYWVLFSALLILASILLWQRGRETLFRSRLAAARRRFVGPARHLCVAGMLLLVACGSWIYANTNVINRFVTEAEHDEVVANYEKEFGKYRSLPQPRVTAIELHAELYPDRRALLIRGTQTLRNKRDVPISQLHVTLTEGYESEVTIDGATEEQSGHPLYRVFTLKKAMKPGDEVMMAFTVQFEPKGFENEVSNMSVVESGTYVEQHVVPQIGFQPLRQLGDKSKRERYGLGKSSLLSDREDPTARQNHYVSVNSDWIDMHTTIGTAADQIAIAPGSLTKSWIEGDRRYFEYQLDHQSLNFYALVSGRYAVATRRWKGIDIEVYHHPEHYWNAEKMVYAVQQALEYYTREFGPYPHKQARIIEFPRINQFAISFPGTMPYSEGMGFVTDMRSTRSLHSAVYLVAHEVAHQWWGHQVAPADAKGGTVLAETLAQYSALMVMKQSLGADMTRRFVRTQMDSYLAQRVTESYDERPLADVDISQAYIHYGKGSVVMYQLQEMIGEDNVNAALRSLLQKFGYQPEPPYPTSIDLIAELRKRTPDKFAPLIDDLFHRIILFANRAVESKCEPLPDGSFRVTFQAECHKFVADGKGKETEIAIDDWIDVAAFAAPEPGQRQGRTLYQERIHVTQSEVEVTFVTETKPSKVGIDPFLLLIDRVSADNFDEPQ
ncbi:MAG: M1 family aminopeptidase [Planctomycetota bacterium]